VPRNTARTSTPRVALTFDAEHADRPDCPPGVVDRLLDTLRDAGARSTFFVQGRWAESQPGTAARIAADGHLVGSHSHYHAPMPLLSDRGIRHDVRSAAAAIRRTTGADPRPWFRCPFTAGEDDPRIRSVIGDLGYRIVSQDVYPGDWKPGAVADDVARAIVDGVREHGDGAIVLLHSWPAVTGDLIAGVLDDLAREGARFVGVDELDATPGTTTTDPRPAARTH